MKSSPEAELTHKFPASIFSQTYIPSNFDVSKDIRPDISRVIEGSLISNIIFKVYKISLK
jgi:hypothetical protein